ncbi:MAG TPA: hypothetical protein VNL71_08950 [Chloroflexota bacterium]|nr:hypothetical protein [Chloroflexota bacterium]
MEVRITGFATTGLGSGSPGPLGSVTDRPVGGNVVANGLVPAPRYRWHMNRTFLYVDLDLARGFDLDMPKNLAKSVTVK